MICVTIKFYLEIHYIVALQNQVKRPIFLALVWSVMLMQKKKKKKKKKKGKINNKLRGASARIRHFRGATIKHLKHHVLPCLVDDTPYIAEIPGGCNDLGYKNKEALSTDDIVNAMLEIGMQCQSHGVKDIFISNLICRKNNFQSNKVNTKNNFLRSACDLLVMGHI